MTYTVRLRVALKVRVYHIGKIIAAPGTTFTVDRMRQPHDLKYTFLYWGPHKVTIKTSRFNEHNFEFMENRNEESDVHVGFGPGPDGPTS